MGRTCFVRGPCATRGRSAKQGPKSVALLLVTLRVAPPTRINFAPSSSDAGWMAGLGGAVGSMGRTCFARGPCTTRGRSAKQGPKSVALPLVTLRVAPPHAKQVRPIEQ
ncbi:hypothetical protein JOD54_002964 [Actinokineospora baliensis]|nr:hypothetical protein [Actinokineospora baliensis]